MNAKSPGFAGLTNCGDGGVFETSLIFHEAMPGFIQPARRPTRGSGEGGVCDMLAGGGAGAAVFVELERLVVDEVAHAATDNPTMAQHANDFTEDSVRGLGA